MYTFYSHCALWEYRTYVRWKCAHRFFKSKSADNSVVKVTYVFRTKKRGFEDETTVHVQTFVNCVIPKKYIMSLELTPAHTNSFTPSPSWCQLNCECLLCSSFFYPIPSLFNIYNIISLLSFWLKHFSDNPQPLSQIYPSSPPTQTFFAPL